MTFKREALPTVNISQPITHLCDRRGLLKLQDAILAEFEHLCGHNGSRHRLLALRERLQRENFHVCYRYFNLKKEIFNG